MLEGKISTNKDIEMEFNRLYNLMSVTNDNKEIVKLIYTDLINLLTNSKDNKKFNYYSIVFEIANYLNNEREFPYLNEFFY